MCVACRLLQGTLDPLPFFASKERSGGRAMAKGRSGSDRLLVAVTWPRQSGGGRPNARRGGGLMFLDLEVAGERHCAGISSHGVGTNTLGCAEC